LAGAAAIFVSAFVGGLSNLGGAGAGSFWFFTAGSAVGFSVCGVLTGVTIATGFGPAATLERKLMDALPACTGFNFGGSIGACPT